MEKTCLSTHGGAGYAPGTYVDVNGTIICGVCRNEIGNINDEKSRIKLPNWIKRDRK